jgi:tetratricopeptide (TPR) repeat protein
MKSWTIFFSIALLLSVSSCGNNEEKTDEKNVNETAQSKVLDGNQELIRLNAALELDPNNVDLLRQRAEILFKISQLEEGLPDIAQAFRLDSSNLEVRRVHAGYMMAINRILSARKDYTFIIEKNPGNAEAYLGMAHTYAVEDFYEKAFHYTNEALKRDKQMRDAYVLKGMMYRVQNKIDFAISSYQTVVEIDPNFASGYVALGNLFEMQKNPIAYEYYCTALEIDSMAMDALYGKALFLQYSDSLDHAQHLYRKMISYDSTWFYAYYNQGWIKLVLQNEYDSASYFFEKTLEIAPSYSDAWLNLGLANVEKKNKVRAVECFKTVLRIDPEHKIAKEELQRLIK